MQKWQERNMNNWDRDNLNFILSCDEAEFDAWMQESEKSDIDYALELLAQHRTELAVKEMETRESVESIEELDCSQAQSVINRIKLL